MVAFAKRELCILKRVGAVCGALAAIGIVYTGIMKAFDLPIMPVVTRAALAVHAKANENALDKHAASDEMLVAQIETAFRELKTDVKITLEGQLLAAEIRYHHLNAIIEKYRNQGVGVPLEVITEYNTRKREIRTLQNRLNARR